ncbi:hypothetical protein JY96_02410 [Aquabacterium sp. NJ1]|nr:hypothetical protein JY96_02410 [Aquabacterium sp. NJ1]
MCCTCATAGSAALVAGAAGGAGFAEDGRATDTPDGGLTLLVGCVFAAILERRDADFAPIMG